MKHHEMTVTDGQKKLNNMTRLRFWMFIGAGATAIQVVLNAFTRPVNPLYLLFEVILVAGCTGYALVLSSHIAKLRAENERAGSEQDAQV